MCIGRYRQRACSQVVCGAPNARTGMKGVFAPRRLDHPRTGEVLKAPSSAASPANGMLCSTREMRLGRRPRRHHRAARGRAESARRAAEVLGLDGPVIDVTITPDRADCLGVRGIARDLAAAGLGRLKPRDVDAGPGRFDSPVRRSARFRAGRRAGLPAVRRPADPRREQRPEPGLAAAPAEGDRPAADLGAGRHHQLRDLRPRPAAARVRRRQARRATSRCAWRGRRDAAGARRQDLRARRRR